MQVSLDCWETFEVSLKNEDYFRLPSISQFKKLSANTGDATTAKDLCTHNTVYVLCSRPLPVAITHFQKLHKLFYKTSITKKRASTEKLYS